MTSASRTSTPGTDNGRSFVWCSNAEQQVARFTTCITRPYGNVCSDCPKFPHRLRLLRNLGSVAVKCPVIHEQKLDNPTASVDVRMAEKLGFDKNSVITLEFCRLESPFFRCVSCPNKKGAL